MAAKKYNIHDLQSLRQQWQEIAIEAIPEKNRNLYKKRKEAVDRKNNRNFAKTHIYIY